ncbi:MAG: galactose-1-phosphate uridylyltransferase [Thermodesulfovibrionales bacterium]|nr:galactose-1-phosphate uridylyltransferase [Thermodesulfovibrionales bacterium]
MHELRKDPLMNRWVAVMSDSMSPGEYNLPGEEAKESECILCSGREKETPPEITAIRENGSNPNEPGWLARVIPSFNPILHVEGDLGRRGVGMYDRMNSIGANEIIIETPEHNKASGDIGFEQMIRVVSLYKERITDLEKDLRLRYILIYKNSGREAGAVYSHLHSQIIATPIIPRRIKEELNVAKQYYSYKERCIFCDIIREELRYGERVIFETKKFIAFCPYAQISSFEFCIIPKRHSCAFQEINSEEMEDLALMLSAMMKKLSAILKNPPYNYIIHTAPNMIPRRNHWHTLGEDYHWHIEVTPRLTRVSGFEWGSGFYVITTSPEDAAKYLREA